MGLVVPFPEAAADVDCDYQEYVGGSEDAVECSTENYNGRGTLTLKNTYTGNLVFCTVVNTTQNCVTPVEYVYPQCSTVAAGGTHTFAIKTDKNNCLGYHIAVQEGTDGGGGVCTGKARSHYWEACESTPCRTQ